MDYGINDLFVALHMLVKPAETGSTGELHEILQLNIYKALDRLRITDISSLPTLRKVSCDVTEESSVRWKFVCVTLHILLSLKEYLMKQGGVKNAKSGQPPPDLLSVSQQKTIKTCLQFVISMGLLPSLLPGVGISLAARCNNVKKLKDEDLVVLEKYERLASVTRGLLVCCEQPALRTVILAEHLGDTMAALSQLSFVPLKKPPAAAAARASEVPGGGAAAAAAKDDFVMTKELWTKLQDDRSHFKSYYLTFVAQVYQPLVIKELLLLQGSGSKAGLKTKPPGWLKRACIQLLVQCLMRAGGVSAMIRAICELSPLDIAEEWVKLDTVVRLITTAHSLQEDVYYKCIGRQMIEMLSLKDSQQNQLLVRVAVLCIKSLSENKPKMCRRYILHVIMTPLLLCTYDPNEGVEPVEKEVPAAYPDVGLPPPAAPDKPTPPPPAAPAVNPCLNLFTGPDSHMVVRIHSQTLLATEEEVSKCVMNLHKCFVAPDSSVNSLNPDLLWLVAPVLFRLHQKIYKSASHLKPYVQELLLRFMSSCMQDKLHSAFGAFLFGDEVEGMVVFSDHVELAFGPEGGVRVTLREDGKRAGNPDVLETQSSEEAGNCLLELLEQGDKVGDMTNVLFVSLLHMLSDPKNESEASRNYMKVSNSELLDLEDVIVGMMGSSKNMVTIKFLIILAGNPSIQDRIHEEPGPIIRFIQYLLEREARVLTESKADDAEKVGPTKVRSFGEDGGDFDEDDNERLYTIVMILGILISSNCDSVRSNWDAFKGLQKPLKLIADNLEDGETRELASRMYNTIVTHGVVNECTPTEDASRAGDRVAADDAGNKTKPNNEHAVATAVKPVNFDELASEFGDLIHQVSDNDKKYAQVKKNKNNRGSQAGTSGKFVAKEGSPCKVALQGVTETAIPIRGHALLELAKLINKRDQEAQRNRNHILRIFQENLKHEDSYIYLTCINGLAAMANVFPNTVITTLTDEFETLRDRKDTTIDPSDLMMKIGEVLVCVTKQLGDFVPAHKTLLLNAFLKNTRDPDPLVRASSLSNLGQVCQALGFRVGPVASEIMLCVRSIVQTDPSVVVRRAAVLVITLLLQGLGEEAMKALGQVMLELYRTLKTVHQQESDDVVKLHCALALEELNRTTLAFLFPTRKMEKQLYVLTPPP